MWSASYTQNASITKTTTEFLKLENSVILSSIILFDLNIGYSIIPIFEKNNSFDAFI